MSSTVRSLFIAFMTFNLQVRRSLALDLQPMDMVLSLETKSLLTKCHTDRIIENAEAEVAISLDEMNHGRLIAPDVEL